MGAGAVIVVMILLGVITFLSVAGYKWNQCKNRDGKSSNVASYVFSFPFTCSANTCVSGFTLDKSGNCVADATTTWTPMNSTDISGIGVRFSNGGDYMSGSSVSNCQAACASTDACDAFAFDTTNNVCYMKTSKNPPYAKKTVATFTSYVKPGRPSPS
jgi:hypothetical protein